MPSAWSRSSTTKQLCGKRCGRYSGSSLANDRRSAMNGCESVADLPIRVLGIGGSTRRDSKSLVLLQSALHLAADAGAEVTLADVRALDLPIYDHDRPLRDYPSCLRELL